ncbi:MAG: primosomal protein N' [Prevotella sp.]|nr:primosomal protein N' [Prevotella sp.]
MTYADLILPLPLQGTFTYALPASMQSAVKVGMRVLVPFGRNKTYLGIVARLHDEQPQGYEVKSVAQLMDAEPIVTPQQLGLWQWISDYYLAPIGDVYKAALPAGLKAEDGYHPKTETYIRLTPTYQTEPALHVALSILGRAPKQLEAFTSYLELSGWDQMEEGKQVEVAEITREELLNASHASAATLQQLEKRGMLETYEVEVGRLNHGGAYHPELIKKLNTAQQDAYNNILMSMMKKPVTLLHGVTSSGKTEIYIHLIQRALERKEQVLYLLPEIALTVQMMQRLQRVFGNRLGIYHSKYSDAERVEIWQKQLSQNPYDVILGARSAVFLPFQRLGLVIVDEEHETSYKQQDPAPRYHARSAAIMLAQMYGARTILGTATPSLESYHNAKTGKYALVELKERYQGIELPEIQVVDIADLQHRKMMAGPFSPLLLNKVREALERGEQAILFQNRRGFAPMIECKQCGWVPHCQHCDVSLTYHRQLNQLTCHYCGYTYRVPTECPCCGSTELRTRGFGTEKIEEQVREVFPEARVARMDLDTTRTRNAYERIIMDFGAGRTNILIGTQMISKGLDFDKVSVVGILNADSMLNYPDFRAYEHAFMMMAQVAGRAGRKGKRGLVILQTKSKEVPVIQQVVRNDYLALYKDLIAERQAFHYPPYYHLVYVYLKHRYDDVVNTASIELGSRLRQWFSGRVLGPDKPAVAKVKSQNIRKLVLKLENGIDMRKVREYLLMAQQQMLADKRYSSLQIYYDVDPL